MVIPDVNVLVYSFRQDTPAHQPAYEWLAGSLGSPTEEVVVPDIVWVGFARVSTNPRVFAVPSTPNEVAGFAESVTQQPTYRAIPGLTVGIKPLFNLMTESDSRGNLVTDAYIAAVAKHLGATVVTYDRDFRRFDNLSLTLLQS